MGENNYIDNILPWGHPLARATPFFLNLFIKE